MLLPTQLHLNYCLRYWKKKLFIKPPRGLFRAHPVVVCYGSITYNVSTIIQVKTYIKVCVIHFATELYIEKKQDKTWTYMSVIFAYYVPYLTRNFGRLRKILNLHASQCTSHNDFWFLTTCNSHHNRITYYMCAFQRLLFYIFHDN